MSSTRQEAFGHWFTAVFITVFGLGILGWFGLSWWHGHQSESWPSTPATLVRAGISSSQDDDDGSWSYAPDVEYAYVVDGQTFNSTTIGFMSSGDYDSSTMAGADVIAQKWRETRDLRAFYDPSNPSRSCLTPGTDIGLFSVIVALLFGGGMLLGGLKMLKDGPD